MPKARSPKRDEAFNLWIQSGEKRFSRGILKDIAATLEVSESQIRKWKNQDDWDGKGGKGTLPIKSKAGKGNVTKKKRGGQPGNSNATGHEGVKDNRHNLKHGIYEKLYWDILTDEEKAMVNDIPTDEEQLFIDQIKLFTARERRLMSRIKEYSEKQGGLALESVVQRKLEIKGNVIEDNKQDQTETTTRTISTFEVITKLEGELTRVQGAKTKCIESLKQLRMERLKMSGESKGNEVVDDWIASVIGGEDDGEE